MQRFDVHYQFGFFDDINPVYSTPKGLSEKIVREISGMKKEPAWMLEKRLHALQVFYEKPLPMWGGDLTRINFDEIYYYVKPTEKQVTSWDKLPEQIKQTYDKIGIPEAEKKFLAGVGAQYDSEVVYHSISKMLSEKGVIFCDTDTAVQKYPELVQKYFGTIIPAADNKFAALNTAVWSGGSFIYVPKGVHIELPLQAYFRINAKNMGQFERTLILADEGSYVHYVEGCTAPIFTTDSLHAAVVEIHVMKGARVRYTTIQNWSKNVYNLVTKRMLIEEEGFGEWIDGNLGCLASGSTVTTRQGIKYIEDIQVGEKILSFDETTQKLCFRTVTAKRFSGYQKVHKVSMRGRSIYVTANHPFYSYNYDPSKPRKLFRYNLCYTRADLLEYAIVPKKSIDFGKSYIFIQPAMETFFVTSNQYASSLTVVRERKTILHLPRTSNPEIMWLFGLFVGDGSTASNEAYTKLRQIMNTIAPKNTVSIRKDGVTSSWNDIQLVEFFENNGFITGCKDKRLPSWVYTIPEEERLALVAGYLDADGTFSVSRGKFSIKSINEELIRQVGKILTTLGIQFSIHSKRGKKVQFDKYVSLGSDSFKIEFDPDERILPYVSDALRKKVSEQNIKKLHYFRTIGRSVLSLSENLEIRSVTVSKASDVIVPTWDIEVEKTSNFVSEGFIVHNSQLTMKYPSVILKGRKARGEVLSLAFAGSNQHQDAGGKAIHLAPETSSVITSKSVSKDGGRTSYRGLLKVIKGAKNSKSTVRCDALILDPKSRADTYPTMEINEERVTIGHEASVSRIGEEQLFYFQSRGIPQQLAEVMIVNGFIEPIVRELPMEYAVELNRLIQLEMVGSVG